MVHIILTLGLDLKSDFLVLVRSTGVQYQMVPPSGSSWYYSLLIETTPISILIAGCKFCDRIGCKPDTVALHAD